MQILSRELRTRRPTLPAYLKILRARKTGALNEPQQKILESMQVAAERLSRTIDNLVDFATLESGGYSIHRDDFDAQSLARSVVDEEKPKARGRRVSLELLVDASGRGWGDERKLRQ